MQGKTGTKVRESCLDFCVSNNENVRQNIKYFAKRYAVKNDGVIERKKGKYFAPDKHFETATR